MPLARAGLMLGFAALVGCGGTFIREGDASGGGGSVGAGPGAGGSTGGSAAMGGTGNGGGNHAYGGSYGGIGGRGIGGTFVNDIGGYGFGGSHGGFGGYGSVGGEIFHGGQGGGSGAGGSFAGQGGSCGPATSPSGPYPVNFVFTTNTPVYIRNDCTLDYDLYSCNSGGTPLKRSAACVADCNSQASGCLACGPCPLGAELIQPGDMIKDSWGGKIYTYGSLPSGCACASGSNAAPGVYHIAVVSYFSAADAMAKTNGYSHTVQFMLPAPNGIVQVDLGFIPL